MYKTGAKASLKSTAKRYNSYMQDDKKPSAAAMPRRKPKASHPWRASCPGQMKRTHTPTAEREIVGISKTNRAR